VTIVAQPADPVHLCTVTNGSGTVADSDVTNVTVDCVTPAPHDFGEGLALHVHGP
jgi:hypothetical protein